MCVHTLNDRLPLRGHGPCRRAARTGRAKLTKSDKLQPQRRGRPLGVMLG
jgi:hypothetical protein